MSKFSDTLFDLRRQYNLPSLGVSFIHNGNSFQHNEDMLYPIASCTKTFTAEGINTLRKQGLLDWDDPIRLHLPEFKLFDTLAGQSMTIRDMLSHQSGLPPHTWAWIYLDLNRNDFVCDRLPHLQSIGTYGGHYRYSNILYAVAGLIIERITGKCWEEFIAEQFLKPLKMYLTFHLDSHWSRQIALPYRRTADGNHSVPFFNAEKYHPIAPASEMMSCSKNLATWLSVVDTSLLFPQVLISDKRVHPSLGTLHYALGWRIETFHGMTHAWHSGTCSGYSSLVSILPEKNMYLCLLTNLHDAVTPLFDMAYTLYECALELERTDWTRVLSWKPVFPEKFPLLEPCNNWNGHYFNPGYGHMNISKNIVSLNGHEAFRLLGAGNEKQLESAVYQKRFPVKRKNEKELQVDFEPGISPVYSLT